MIWLSMWTLGGGFATYALLWQLRGCEVITVSPTALEIKRDLFGFGQAKRYDVSEIRDLRFAPPAFTPFDFRSSMAFWGLGSGVLAFDYGYKTFRYGAGIDEAEARLILQKIVSRLPRLTGDAAE